MKKLKKSLSVLLTLVMLFTTLCFFPLDFGKVEADASTAVTVGGLSYTSVDDAIIVVPETVYMTPSTGASTTGQYYVNNTINKDSKTVTPEVNAANANGYVQFYIPGATDVTIAVNTITSGIGDIILTEAGTTSGSYEGASLGSLISNGWFEYNTVGLYISGTGITAGNTALAEWIFTVTMSDGSVREYRAYSVLYAPYYQPVGAAAKAKAVYHNTFASSILWVSGVHGYSDGDSNNRWYIQTANFIPMLGTIKTPGNNNPDTNWIQSGSNGLSPTINYQSVEAGGVDYHARANSISPTANIAVDTSRYNNFNQIPNFSVGFMVTDRQNANEGPNWYVSDFTGQTSSYYNGTATGSSEYSGDFNSSGTQFSSGNDSSTGIKYNGTWNKAISGTASFRIKSAVKTKTNKVIDTTAWNNNFVNISVTGVNKAELRKLMMLATSLNYSNYEETTYGTGYLESAMRTAGQALGNPTATTDVTTAYNTLYGAIYGSDNADLNYPLQMLVKLNANGDNVTLSKQAESVTVKAATSANVTPTATATRTGYTFKGWATSPTGTAASTANVSLYDRNLYAIWEANKYNVVFDNMFDFNAFNITGSLDINERTDKGFTVTSTAADGNTGFSSAMPVEPGKTYVLKADVQLEAVSGGYDMYVHTLDANQAGETTAVPDTTNGAHREGNVYISLTGQTTNTTPYIRFTAGDNTAFIKIRFDANAVDNKLTVNNIRVYEEGTIADGVSYEAPYVATYDSTYVLPTPTRENYAFAGWYTTPSGDGTRYSTGDTVKITETLHLYSRWTDANYFIAFDANTGNGTMATVKANVGENYTLPANTFTKTGYHFVGWSTDKSATAGTYADEAGVQLATTVSTVTLYAVWAKNDYTINYVGGDGATGNTAPQAVKYDETATIRANGFSKPGYIFKGWTDGTTTYAAGQDVKNLTTVNGATITLTAVWEPITFTVDFVINDVVVDTFTVTYDNGDAAKFDAVKDKFNVTGYTFGGWETKEGTAVTSDNFDNLVTANGGEITIYAIENENSYTIQYNGNTATSGDTAQQTVKYTDVVTLNNNGFIKTGYTFVGWAETADGDVKYANGATGLEALTAEPDGLVTLYAVWEANTYTVKFDNNDAAATGSTADVALTYDEAKALTMNGFSKTGWSFVGWATAPDGEAVYEDGAEVINLTADKNGVVTLYAVWEINTFEVTFNYKNVDGTDATLTLPAVEYGTAFSAIVPSVPATYYLSTDTVNHYNFVNDWENKVETITEAVVFTAKYEEEAHLLWDDNKNMVAPNCENDGIYAVICDCGYSHQEVAPATGHNYQDVPGENTATCTEDGMKVQRCNKTNCPHPEIQTVSEATGHVFGETTPLATPDCTNTGNSAYKSCSVCNKFFAEDADKFSENAEETADAFVIPAKGHETTYVPAVAPECEKDGTIAYYTCENCTLLFKDEAGTIVITEADTIDPQTGHSYEADVTPPSCTTDGYTTHTCSKCNDTYTDTPVSKLGHTDGEEVIENNVNPTCTEAGSYDTVTYCTVCGAETSRVTTVVSKLGHSEGTAVEENRKESTCTEKGSYDSVVYCIVCNEKLSSVKVDLPLAAHNYVANVTPPTCVDDGYTTHTCSVCNASYTDSTVDALGHTAGEKVIENNVKPDCTTAGSYDEVVYCTVCGEELSSNKVTVDALGHDYDAVVTDPTCTAGGFTTYTCKVCGDNYTDDATDALGHKAGAAVVENDKPATCLVDGSYQEVVYCSVCNTELSRTNKVHTAPGHTQAVRQENVENATCTVAGSYDNVTYCTVCGEVLKREKVTGVTLPHTYTEKKVDADHLKTEATCVSYAVYYYDCKDCEANAKDADADTFEYVEGGYNADNHTMTTKTLKNEYAATCYKDGYSGDLHYDCCDAIAESGNVISKDTVAHTAGAVVVENNVLPTCYSEGSYDNVTYCSVCEEAGYGKVQTSRETVTVDKVAHTAGAVVVENNVLPTCYSEGSYDNVTYCSVCENAGQGQVQLSRETITVDKVAHTPGEVVVENNVEPTCYSTGSYDNVTYCSVCEAAGKAPVETSRDTVIVPKTAHTPAAAVEENVVPATCYSEGSYNAVVYCSVEKCGHKISSTPKTIAKLAHTPAEAVEENVVPATCYSEGSYDEVVYCSVEACHEKLSTTPKTIEKIAHTPGAVVVENNVAPTCYSEGSYDNVTYCTVCEAAGEGKVQITRDTVTVDMVDHTPGTAVTENVVAPKCEEDGSHDVVVYCSVCAAADKKTELSRETVVDTMTGHTEGEAKVENNVPATCTENGSYDLVVRCTICNEIITSEAKVNVAPGHKAGAAVTENVVKATCTEGGTYEEATYCTVCGVETSRDYKTTEALGHTAAEAVIENEVKVTCTTDGSYDTVVYCAVCDTEISRETTVIKSEGHKAGEVVYENVTPATETENGKRDEVTYCTVCGTELSRETVVLRPVRIITFIMHDETIEVEAHTGDTLTPPTVKSYESADGFIHQFKNWDKELKVVTGNETYTATYTEPCDYTEIDRLEETLNDILAGGLVDDETLNEYKDKIDDIKAKLEVINANRNTLDKENQADIDVVVDDLEELVDFIYPDVGSTLEIVGASTFYTGSILDLKAVKMPANAVISEVQWTSSDDNIVFCSNGKLFAIGVGKVTITAKRGILTATKTINVVEGGDVRAINFISMDKAHIIVEDYFTVFNAAGLYWSDANEIRFRVHVYQNFPYETYIVYINGVEAEPDADGYYTVPANAGNVRVSLAGAVYKDDSDDSGSSGKWSFWEWLLMIFRKIAALFGITL